MYLKNGTIISDDRAKNDKEPVLFCVWHSKEPVLFSCDKKRAGSFD